MNRYEQVTYVYLLILAAFLNTYYTGHAMHTLFGTDGIRNRVGISPFTAHELPRLGAALAQWALSKTEHPRILIGYDTRASNHWVLNALNAGLLRYPVTIYDGGILPTPAVCLLTNIDDTFDFGMIISASHNPYHDTGIKLITPHHKLSPEDEHYISSLFYADTTPSSYDTFGTCVPYHRAAELYISYVVAQFPPSFLSGKKIVLDCAHGATSSVAPAIFTALGATVYPLHNEPTGTNINDQCGALHPEHCARAVVDLDADIGFAFDGDGDRVMIIDKDGTIHNGDTALALLLHHDNYKHCSMVVGTSMSNHALSIYLDAHNKQLIRTAVGDKYIAQALEEHNLLMGGEQSGHIILRDYLHSGDGIFVALRILETIIQKNIASLALFTPYPQIIINIPIREKKDLNDEPFYSIIRSYESQLHTGRCVVRYSGTEHILRIMIEDDSLEHATYLGNQLSSDLSQALNP